MRVVAIAAVLLILSACGAGGGDTVAQDPNGSPGGTPLPSEVPAADGPVRSRGLVMVMDVGRPELCLGPIAESWPPQCGGPPIRGWEWSAYDGMFERQGEIRWGEFGVTGRWDGTTFSLTDAVPAALHDAAPTPSPEVPSASVRLSEQQLASIAAKVGSELSGAQGAYTTEGHVLVDVTYDDGSLQAWADEQFGDGVVIVTSALVDAPTR